MERLAGTSGDRRCRLKLAAVCWSPYRKRIQGSRQNELEIGAEGRITEKEIVLSIAMSYLMANGYIYYSLQADKQQLPGYYHLIHLPS
jgi:hypothetical protein